MIQKLSIQNFKSIKSLELDCKRVNLFIGEPNVGKSNILEAMSIQALQHTLDLKGLVRFNDLSNLFYENDPSNKVIISTDDLKTEIEYKNANVRLSFRKSSEPVAQREFHTSFSQHSFESQGANWNFKIYPYHFRVQPNYPVLNYNFLNPPHGDNLFFLLQTNKALRSLVGQVILDRGFKLTLRQKNYEIEITKEEDSILTAYPFSVISDTLQRIIFYISAIDTAQEGSTILFEEPESNVFPYYTKYLAEKISNDQLKQYFLTTHNPYFLQSIIEKTPSSDLALHLVQMHKYNTKVTTLNDSSIEKVMDLGSDVFLNFNYLLNQ